MILNNDKILGKARDIFPKICQYRREIHQNPELSFAEYKTSAFIKSELDKLNIPYKTYAATGGAGLVGSGGKCVALRADIDALPMGEETGLEFSSVNDGVMHACGHDAHTAILLGVAEVLAGLQDRLPGTVVFLFQPAEEGPPEGEAGGAPLMVAEGALDDPPVEAVFGLHVGAWAESGQAGWTDGAVFASSDTFSIQRSEEHTSELQSH